MLFSILLTLIILQRLSELMIAKQNEKRMKQQGALEFGQAHYRFIVTVHSLFFVSYLLEVIFLHKSLSPGWPMLIILFLLTQAGRIWALTSLGPYWNTKIIVLPDADIVTKGPYRYIKHPNYLIVAIEFIIIPLIFQAYFTAIIFTILNGVILAIRIPAEEKALKQLTEYKEAFASGARLIKDVKKV